MTVEAKIDTALFDVGGPLKEETGHMMQDIKRTLQISEQEFQAGWEKYIPLLRRGEISEAEFWREFLISTNTQQPLPQESLFLREYAQHYMPRVPVLKLVQQLKENGYRVGIVSNTIEPHANFLRNQGLFSDFPPEFVLLSNEVGISKPDITIFQLALERTQSLAEQTVFIDDTVENVIAARSIGIHGIIFENTKQLKTDLGKLHVSYQRAPKKR